MPRKTLLLLALCSALLSCACTTRQSASPLPPVPVVAPCPKTPLPPELAQRPTPPPALTPGYFAQHPE